MGYHRKLPTTDLNNLPGRRPTRVIIGTWIHSSKNTQNDRQAVFGIITPDDRFGFKVVNQTSVGRFVNGNFPTGVKAIWLTYDQVDLDNHIKHLAPVEIREYVRFRQYQIDILSQNDITEALEQAKLRWASYEQHHRQEPQGLNDNGAGPAASSGPDGPPLAPLDPLPGLLVTASLIAMGPIVPGSTLSQVQDTLPLNQEGRPMGHLSAPATAVRNEHYEAGRTSSAAASRVAPNSELSAQVGRSQNTNRPNVSQSKDSKVHGALKYD